MGKGGLEEQGLAVANLLAPKAFQLQEIPVFIKSEGFHMSGISGSSA